MSSASSSYVHGFLFTGKVGEISAYQLEDVVPALRSLEEKVASGLHAAGFVSYDAAPALNPDFNASTIPHFPLLWFGLYEGRSAAPFPDASDSFSISEWDSSCSADEFAAAVASIRELIAAGDCYQVNLTMRQRFSFSGSSPAFFGALCRTQPTPYSSYLESGRYTILSASPELFFSLANGTLTTRPMKGTAPRGRWADEDEAQKSRLRETPKELAENVMIVDLLRNDMGMVSQTGSVRVASLFDVESHPTLHQMTSTIESKVKDGVGVLDVMRALFPCGSVTGAPKRRTMEIINDLEPLPRGVYTGCIGYVSPGGEAAFSVAIRTAVLDVDSGRGEIGVGCGITYDSSAAAEYAEALSKSRFARERVPEFHLIESLLFDDGYFLLDRHLERLQRSAGYFSFPLDDARVLQALQDTALTLAGRHKVRLLLFRDGRIRCEAAPLAAHSGDASVGFARTVVSSADRLLYHKTSMRARYDAELARRPDLAEVIFFNERGEVTEGANSNIVAVVDGRRVTPPVESGLLPGVFRGELLNSGDLVEGVLTREDLETAQEIYLINSVRKWRRARLVREGE